MRKTPARNLPIKQRGLGNFTDSGVSSCIFPDVPAFACLPSVSDRDGKGQLLAPPYPGNHLRERDLWPPTLLFGGLIPLGLSLKARPQESWGKERDGHWEVGKQSSLPCTLDLSRKKAHFPLAFCQSKPITSSGGSQTRTVLPRPASRGTAWGGALFPAQSTEICRGEPVFLSGPENDQQRK